MDSFSVQADPSGIREASLWLERMLTQNGVPEAHRSRLDLCFNEVAANILYHGGESAVSGLIFLELTVRMLPDADGQATITVSDAGTPFDPVSALPALRPESLSDAEPGGLGLIMLHKLTDELRYSLADGRNRLSFAVRWSNSH
ncbi:MAG: hypothetical protein BVN35_17190 [Proteobacteria bacterium ST_bin11]|nr:MAG: hypothetical protein BVN35_17190 [Proteobacteria bacterium ST_bin11]